ncbi:MAG: DegT/DnrJ/EryC1/StrS family aminotransferase [Acidobacteriota bacterium]|nr:DegT/DnrJ/EryC1/StrS family aminotransferase [Acidobacteriota bacterium]
MTIISAPPAVPVPLLDLKKQYATLKDEILRVTSEVYESQGFILGPRVDAFEKAVAAYVGAKHAIGMSSGTDAQLAVMMALGIGPGDDVVTSPYTFFASAGAVARLGARPVFVDVEPETFNLDPAKLEKALTPKTKLIQPVHLYGQCADMDPIRDVAKRKGIPVLEDACQSLGAAYKGVKAGALGESCAFSFFPSKNLGGFGDGGMVTTSDDALAAMLRAMRMHGETSRYHHKFVGGNFRIDALQAAILHVKLPHLDGWAEARRTNAKDIERRYLEAGGLPFEKGGLRFPREAAGRHHVFNQFVVRVGGGRRDSLKEYLEKRSIGAAIYYPVPLHLQECFSSLGGKVGDFPESERAAKETLAIPVFPELTGDQKTALAGALAEFSSSSLGSNSL